MEVEAEKAGRVALTEVAEEARVRDMAVPSLGDERGTDEAGREAEAEEDQAEKVVVAEHQRDRVR